MAKPDPLSGDLRDRIEAAMRRDDFSITTMADAVMPVVEAETARAEADTLTALTAARDQRHRAEKAERERDTAREALDAAAIVIASLRDQRDQALAALTRHAAEAHRRKWAHEDVNQAAFDALHRLGDEILTSRDRLTAALKPNETPACQRDADPIES